MAPPYAPQRSQTMPATPQRTPSKSKPKFKSLLQKLDLRVPYYSHIVVPPNQAPPSPPQSCPPSPPLPPRSPSLPNIHTIDALTPPATVRGSVSIRRESIDVDRDHERDPRDRVSFDSQRPRSLSRTRTIASSLVRSMSGRTVSGSSTLRRSSSKKHRGKKMPAQEQLSGTTLGLDEDKRVYWEKGGSQDSLHAVAMAGHSQQKQMPTPPASEMGVDAAVAEIHLAPSPVAEEDEPESEVTRDCETRDCEMTEAPAQEERVLPSSPTLAWGTAPMRQDVCSTPGSEIAPSLVQVVEQASTPVPAPVRRLRRMRKRDLSDSGNIITTEAPISRAPPRFREQVKYSGIAITTVSSGRRQSEVSPTDTAAPANALAPHTPPDSRSSSLQRKTRPQTPDSETNSVKALPSSTPAPVQRAPPTPPKTPPEATASAPFPVRRSKTSTIPSPPRPTAPARSRTQPIPPKGQGAHRHHCIISGHLFLQKYLSPEYPTKPFNPPLSCERCRQKPLFEAWQCAITRRCGVVVCDTCKQSIEEDRVRRVLAGEDTFEDEEVEMRLVGGEVKAKVVRRDTGRMLVDEKVDIAMEEVEAEEEEDERVNAKRRKMNQLAEKEKREMEMWERLDEERRKRWESEQVAQLDMVRQAERQWRKSRESEVLPAPVGLMSGADENVDRSADPEWW